MKPFIVMVIKRMEHSCFVTKTIMETFTDAEEAKRFYEESRVDGDTVSCGFYRITE